ncbi:MAG TPA: redoxin family protein [Fimbriimonadaceae bacterium]|nr:redoxin family protein [Fimbriimonadaceae bacterium]
MLCTLLTCAAFGGVLDDQADQVMRHMDQALEKVERVECQVSFGIPQKDADSIPGTASVQVAASPPRYSSRLQARDVPWRTVAVQDGGHIYGSADGRASSSPDYGSKAIQVLYNVASLPGDFAYYAFLDREERKRVIDEHAAMYLQPDEVEGVPCDLIVTKRSWAVGKETIMLLTFLWVDKSTGLPAAYQTDSLMRGQQRPGIRYEFSDVKLNPTWASDPFAYRPVDGDSTALPEEKPTVEAHTAIGVGSALPDLGLQSLDLSALRLRDTAKGPVLVTFFASWCGPCREELEALESLDIVKSKKLSVVAIGTFDSKKNLRKFAEERAQDGIRFCLDPDCEEKASPLAAAFGLSAIPHAFLVGREGKVIAEWVGFDSVDGLKKQLAALGDTD